MKTILFASLFLVGCMEHNYIKPNVTPNQQKADEHKCNMEALDIASRTYGIGNGASAVYLMKKEECLRDIGYTMQKK